MSESRTRDTVASANRQAAVRLHSYLDGIQLDWLQHAELNLSELWDGYASLLLQGGAPH